MSFIYCLFIYIVMERRSFFNVMHNSCERTPAISKIIQVHTVRNSETEGGKKRGGGTDLFVYSMH